jgi:hypothetical protein
VVWAWAVLPHPWIRVSKKAVKRAGKRFRKGFMFFIAVLGLEAKKGLVSKKKTSTSGVFGQN